MVADLSLDKFLPRKNPYMLRALALENASEIVERILSHHITASDETIFGDAFFEPIAMISSGGTVSPTEGVDIVIETATDYKAIAVKSGPNVQNASQKKRQATEFNSLRARLLKIHKQYDPIVGHCYGRYNAPPTKAKTYRDLSGQAFWQEITGDADFYLKLMRLMRDSPAEHRKEFETSWSAAVNRLTASFVERFCFSDGRIDWEKLTAYVSAFERPPRPKKTATKKKTARRPATIGETASKAVSG